ncbi:LacI family DNA-binding transcriptional regulator [Thermocatellispora tengchongensis]|uniref:LacI family DNA-binding transcriptional regulator n=1 Tax=Thermocatellispora tengchongensis TaxID=1073253 RepID=UPI0036401D07
MSIKDVAARAGVSPGTVSNVLNRPEKVAASTRTRVERAISELGFVRHGSASSLRAGHSRTIGLSVIDIGNPFFTDVAAGVEDVASDRGYAVILGNSSGDRMKEQRNLLVFAEQRVRGCSSPRPTRTRPALTGSRSGVSTSCSWTIRPPVPTSARWRSTT